MTERLLILSHHEQVIRKWYPDIVDFEEAKSRAREISLKGALRSRKGPDSSYPLLKYGSSETRERYVESIAREIIALNTGNYEIVPDLDKAGDRVDEWCQSCGNLGLTEDGKFRCNG